MFALCSNATHIIGGYLHYEHLGTDQYKVTITVYKDCQDYVNSNGDTITPWGFDNIFGNPSTGTPNAVLTVYSHIGGVLDSTGYYFTEVNISQVNIDDPDSCKNLPPDVCVQKGVYSITLTLPDITDNGYYLSYQRCCRNPSSVNVDVDPNGTGITLAGYIPKLTSFPENSNPEFVNNPPIAFCLLNEMSYDMSAYDDDGDSLAYEFTTPLDGAGTSTSGTMNPVIPPPYDIIDYNPGFTATDPMTSVDGITIDPVTGIMSGIPSQLGAFIIGVKVSEYRNSILISETIRDLRFYVLDCGENMAEFEPEDHICDGIDSFKFISHSSDVNTYLWNFGDSQVNTDTSSMEFPSYVYNENGQYLVSLITNQGTECEDIDTHTVNFRNSIDLEVGNVSGQCFDGNNFSFSIISYDFPVGTTIDWDFGPNASPSTGKGFVVNDISYDTPGMYTVSATATYQECQSTSSIQIQIYPEIEVSIPDIFIACIHDEFTVQPDVINPNYSYSWSLGGMHISNQASFDMTVDSVTLLDLELVVTDNYGCTRTITKSEWLEVKNQSTAEFEISDTVIFLEDALDITNFASNYTSIVYHFGNGDTTTEENPTYIYNDIGIYTITQVVDNGGNCPDYYHKTVEIRYDHYIYFPNVFTPNGDGTNDTFFPVRDGIKSYSLEIYDRWGKKVYNGAEQKFFHEWDGVYESGQKGAQEVYNYFCTYVTEKEEVYDAQGVVLLLK